MRNTGSTKNGAVSRRARDIFPARFFYSFYYFLMSGHGHRFSLCRRRDGQILGEFRLHGQRGDRGDGPILYHRCPAFGVIAAPRWFEIIDLNWGAAQAHVIPQGLPRLTA